MLKMVKKLLLTALVSLCCIHATAAVRPTAQKQIRLVISDQLDAFVKGDARRAFAHASPLIQERLQSPERFMEMIRDGYTPIFRHSSVQFLKQDEIDSASVFQYVQLSADDGHVWLVRYRMLKIRRGQWKIDGCELQPTDGVMT
jgi:hypothetical protein